MENEKQYPEWFKKMMQDILDMRDKQKEYFTQPNDSRKRASMAKEQRVDLHINFFINAKLISHKEKPENIQPSLFKTPIN